MIGTACKLDRRKGADSVSRGGGNANRREQVQRPTTGAGRKGEKLDYLKLDRACGGSGGWVRKQEKVEKNYARSTESETGNQGERKKKGRLQKTAATPERKRK